MAGTDWVAISKTNPFVAQALREINFDDYGASAPFDAAISKRAAELAAQTGTAFQTSTTAYFNSLPAQPSFRPTARSRLATTTPTNQAPTTALRTYGAFLGGTGLGSTDPLLGSDSGTTARGRLLG